jgi:type I restriction enzyme S subunit
MSEWRELQLGSLVNIKHGYAFSGQDICVEETESILVTPGNFHIGGGFKDEKLKFFKGSYPQSYVLNSGDVIVTMTDLSKEGNTLGYSAKVPASKNKVFLHNQRIGLVEFLSEDADRDFLYWLMRTRDYQSYVVGAATGTSVKHTSPTSIREYRFFMPCFYEQKAIAQILSNLDDKIDLLHRQNKTLEAIAETLFRQWFIEEAQEDWEEKPLSTIADFLNGLACQKLPPKNDTEKLPVLKIRELKSGIGDDCDYATTDVNPEYVVNAGDVIFAWSASLIVKIWDGQTCVLNQHLFKVTSKEFPKWFYYHWCKIHLDEFIAISQAHATTMGHIKRGDLDTAIVTVPHKDQLDKMNKNMSPILEKIEKNHIQIRTLEKLRDTLLPKLMSGEVRVSY